MELVPAGALFDGKLGTETCTGLKDKSRRRSKTATRLFVRKRHGPVCLRPAPPVDGHLLDVRYTQNLKRTDARRSADLNLISLALANQSTGYGRADRNFPVLGLCLMITDDLIYHLIASITIGQRH